MLAESSTWPEMLSVADSLEGVWEKDWRKENSSQQDNTDFRDMEHK